MVARLIRGQRAADNIPVGTPDTDEPLASYVDGDAWVCIFCTHRNDLAEPACGNCGLTFRGGRRPEEPGQRLRRPHLSARTASPAIEAAIALGLFAVYRLGDIAAGTHTAGAVGRGRDVWDLERDLHLPSERSLQQQLLPHIDLLHGLNIYYAAAHLGGMTAAALWLYLRHRASYGRWRNAVVTSTAACFALQLIPVAPPRLVPGLGLVDTAKRLGESVYSHAHLANQVSSFPSVHFGWALLVAAIVIGTGTTRKRWLIVLHPILTLLAIVATANHYWLDALAAAVIALACIRLTRPANAP
jgi:hypothetical protein